MTNIRLGKSFYGRIQKHADFFGMTKNRFMNVLLSVGIEDYFKNNEIKFHKVESAKTEIKRLNEINRILEQSSKAVKESKSLTYEEYNKLEDEMFDLRKKINSLTTRCKIEISFSQSEQIQEILEKENCNQKKENAYCQGDIIYSLIQYTLNAKLSYLSEQSVWKTNLIEDSKCNTQKNIRFSIPYVFYEFLDNRASYYNISVQDYLKLLITDEFEKNEYAEKMENM